MLRKFKNVIRYCHQFNSFQLFFLIATLIVIDATDLDRNAPHLFHDTY